MTLSSDEIDVLLAVVDYYAPDLRAEIAQTTQPQRRARLRAHEATLLGVRDKLVAARRAAVENEAADDLGL